MPKVETWVQAAPLVVTVVCLLVDQHPSPVDDCPCFEDAIAFASVILGVITKLLALKARPRAGYRPVHLRHPRRSTRLSRAITTYRIPAEPSMQTLLPLLFRWLAWASPMRLPHRRHYMPATVYVHSPPHTPRAVPSMIDLDLSQRSWTRMQVSRAGACVGEALRLSGAGPPSGSVQEKAAVFEEASKGSTWEDGKVKHYDADVLTNVVVYVGIGAIATVMVPALFEAFEWGV
ncbi:hypothetical protein EDB86DRAFT_3088148 [Lactarius hatsudake]|nr:hypothetical protein EDB86DRAFT_3088148 [Lactarius hatsudake]